MSFAAVSVSQIRAQIAAIYRNPAKTPVIGIRANGRWIGNESLQIDDTVFQVRQCESVLQIRATLLDQQSAKEPLVILTNVDETELGQDLLARFTKRRIFGLQPWPILLEMFQARQAAPGLLKKKWLAEFLLEELPPQGFPAVASAVLDEETVWRVVLCQRMGFATARPDTRELLEWALDANHLARYQTASAEVRQGICEWVLQAAGEAGRLIFQCVENGYGTEALALGLSSLVIFNEEQKPELREAAVRLERFTGGMPVSPAAALAWGKQAARLIEQKIAQGDMELAAEQLEKSDRLLSDLRVEPYAWLSPYSPRGYEQMIARFAEKLLQCLQPNAGRLLAEINQDRQEIERHQSQIQPERLKRLQMAVRLLHWLQQAEPAAPAGLVAAAQRYVQEGGWVDRARQAIARGDAYGVLSEGYRQLYEKVTARRETQNQQFGQLLAQWTELGSLGDGVLRIEEILARVVAPLAQRERVLLVVVDGMSYAVFHELLADIQTKGWQSLTPEPEAWPVPVLAALPTVTEVSRTSLLCGQLWKGTSADEVAGFKSNPDLLAVTKTKYPPVLFHKGNLTVGGGSALTEEIQREIAAERRKVVGAVINAIDDHLAKGEQTNIPWVLRHVPVLEHLLECAWQSARVVVITSDHGHILENDSAYRKSDSGERYRAADTAPQADEYLIAGSRVLHGTAQKIIAPWAEKVRYGRKKHGYHGGITPQECIVPLAVLARTNATVPGWHSFRAPAPPWWK